jgi:hypothetical protein
MDLTREFHAACAATPVAALTHLYSQGVPFRAAWGPMRCAVARVRVYGNGLFEPDPGGTPHVIVADGPIDRAGRLEWVDQLVAYRAGDPSRWHVRLFGVDVLGVEAIEAAKFDRGPLTLHPTPAAWLATGCQGACIARWDVNPLTAFLGISELRPASPALAERLNARIAECTRPPFRVRPPAAPKRQGAGGGPRVDWRSVPVAVFASLQLPDGSYTVTGVPADGSMPALDRAPGFIGFER